jgi:hypothetical protein
MSIHKYIVRERDGLWEVRFDSRLVSGQPTRREALDVAKALAYAATLRGERTAILAGTMDGVTVELPAIEPEAQRA